MNNWTWERTDDPWQDSRNTKVVFALGEYNGDLYLGTRNFVTGGEVLRSRDGIHWQTVAAPGFGSPDNRDIYGFVGFGGRLYAGTYNPATGGEIWRSHNGAEWEPVMRGGLGDRNSQDMFNFVVFGDHLYVGTWNPNTGAEIWRTASGPDWQKVFHTGTGNQDYIRAFARMGSRLYASTGKLKDWSLMETSDGTNWSDVARGHVPEYLTDGLRIVAVGEALVVGASHWKETPVELWRYAHGTWQRISEPGLGVPTNMSVGGISVHEGRVAVATWNEQCGTQVWVCDDLMDPDWRKINQDGFGDFRNTGCMFGMTSFRGRLLVGTGTDHEDWASQLWCGTECSTNGSGEHQAQQNP